MERPTTAPVSRRVQRTRDKKVIARASTAVLAAKKNARLKQIDNKTIINDFIHDVYQAVRHRSKKLQIIYYVINKKTYTLWKDLEFEFFYIKLANITIL